MSEGNGTAEVVKEEPRPTIVDENDRLRAELINTKLMNNSNAQAALQYQIAHIQLQIGNLQREQQNLTDQMTQQRAYLEQKYSIDLNTYQIAAETGIVQPRPQGMLPR